uniref:DnaJ homolog subfamily C member 24 n=1 Tax=Cacopsylla melanoneura TaxID=428564 RepID=A0A8D8XYS0_9HEMI
MNYFEILNCDVNSTTEEIKENYRNLILKFHPDKGHEDQEMFVKINEAWTVLKDEKQRKLYESQLLSNEKSHLNVYKCVCLEDMQKNGDGFSCPCRCGSEFCISEEDTQVDNVNDGNLFISCDTCSLLLEIIPSRC